MFDPISREPDQIRQDAARKVRVVQMIDHFLAILDCLLGEDCTTPRLVETMTSPVGQWRLENCDGEKTGAIHLSLLS
jgi:hypothetical protein